MPIDAETQAALDTLTSNLSALSATVTQHRQQAVTAVTRIDGRIDDLEAAAQRLKRALRDGRFDGDAGTFVDALGAALGVSVRDLRDALAWATAERRKAKR